MDKLNYSMAHWKGQAIIEGVILGLDMARNTAVNTVNMTDMTAAVQSTEPSSP